MTRWMQYWAMAAVSTFGALACKERRDSSNVEAIQSKANPGLIGEGTFNLHSSSPFGDLKMEIAKEGFTSLRTGKRYALWVFKFNMAKVNELMSAQYRDIVTSLQGEDLTKFIKSSSEKDFVSQGAYLNQNVYGVVLDDHGNPLVEMTQESNTDTNGKPVDVQRTIATKLGRSTFIEPVVMAKGGRDVRGAPSATYGKLATFGDYDAASHTFVFSQGSASSPTGPADFARFDTNAMKMVSKNPVYRSLWMVTFDSDGFPASVSTRVVYAVRTVTNPIRKAGLLERALARIVDAGGLKYIADETKEDVVDEIIKDAGALTEFK